MGTWAAYGKAHEDTETQPSSWVPVYPSRGQGLQSFECWPRAHRVCSAALTCTHTQENACSHMHANVVAKGAWVFPQFLACSWRRQSLAGPSLTLTQEAL